jgi:hypothetical protein
MEWTGHSKSGPWAEDVAEVKALGSTPVEGRGEETDNDTTAAAAAAAAASPANILVLLSLLRIHSCRHQESGPSVKNHLCPLI